MNHNLANPIQKYYDYSGKLKLIAYNLINVYQHHRNSHDRGNKEDHNSSCLQEHNMLKDSPGYSS